MDVCVVGLGYIGLPTACLFAQAGLSVTGVDVDAAVRERVASGRFVSPEPGLASLVASAVVSGRLAVSDVVVPSSCYIIAVPTPVNHERGPDLAHVEAAVRAIAPTMEPGAIVVVESTVPVGATRRMHDLLRELRPDLVVGGEATFQVAHCPERVLPGRILDELVSNRRIVGGVTLEAAEVAAKYYRLFVKADVGLATAEVAEMAKLAENAYRDVNIAFANELSMLAQRLGVDVWEVIDVANRHPRVNILSPGPGVGGHCIAVDPWFLIAEAPDLTRVMAAARETDRAKRDAVVSQVLQVAADGTTVALFGLAYKANVDDLRESPALEIARRLSQSGRFQVVAVEPHIDNLPEGLEKVRLVSTEEALAVAQTAVLLVDHDAFQSIDPDSLADKHVVDTRGGWRRVRRG